MAWRQLRPADLPGVLGVAAVVHPGFPEDAAVLGERLALYPAGCFALDGPGFGLAGYLLSHPWRAFDPPPLNRRLGALPSVPTTYYIHDLALHPTSHGTGAAGAILRRVFALAAGGPALSLVAVNGSAGFWRHHGFAAVARPELAAKLASYGLDAAFMTRPS